MSFAHTALLLGAIFVSVGSLFLWIRSRRRHHELLRQSSELAHDCETLLTLVHRVSEISEHSHRYDPFLRDMEKYIRKWRAISNDQMISVTTELEFIPSLIQEAVERMRLSDSFKNVTFEVQFKALPFSRVGAHEFLGSIRNLLKNAAQAVAPGQKGWVRVIVEEIQERVCIIVEDNGQGIPMDVQDQIFVRGTTFGKKNGSGLGLSSTKHRFESWGGGIELIKSAPGQGTVFRLFLPKAPPPAWFQNYFRFEVGTDVVQLDDDESILPVTEGKMAHLFHQLDLHFFVSEKSVVEYLENSSDRKKIFLVDYYLNRKSGGNLRVKNGIDLIQALKIEDRSILLTNGWQNPKIQAQAYSAGVKIFPKQFLSAAQFELQDASQTRQQISLVLIDDQEIFRQDWAEAAAAKGLSIVTCASVSEFLERYHYLPKSTPIYVDEFLDGGLKGQEESLALVRAGFTEIHLTTFDSMAELDLPVYPHLKSVLGKRPPI